MKALSEIPSQWFLSKCPYLSHSVTVANEYYDCISESKPNGGFQKHCTYAVSVSTDIVLVVHRDSLLDAPKGVHAFKELFLDQNKFYRRDVSPIGGGVTFWRNIADARCDLS